MKVNVMPVAPQFVPQFQSFVRDPTHAFAVDPEILHLPNGQVHAFGPDTYYDDWFAKAAAKTYVSCEELIDRMEDHYPADAQANIVERCFISGVVELPGGAHPSSMPPAYGWDMKAFKAYADSAKDPGDWATAAERFVGASEADYLASVGGKEAVAALPLPVF